MPQVYDFRGRGTLRLSESPLGRIHPTRPTLLRRRYRLRNRLSGGPESVWYGWEAKRTN